VPQSFDTAVMIHALFSSRIFATKQTKKPRKLVFHWHGLGGVLIVLALIFHQQSELLPAWWFGLSGCLLLGAALVTWLLKYRLHSWLLLFGVCLIAWCSWTNQAQQRLDDRLSAQWEGREIQVTGLIASMPQQKQFSQRFDFLVSAPNGAAEIRLPKKIVLSWAPTFSTLGSVQYLEPGQLWTFTVKLKRPVGAINFEGFDSELNALRQHIGAYGGVQKNAAQFHCNMWCWQIWQSDLWTSLPAIALERLRLRISQALDELTPLSGERATGVIKALAIGEQSAITAGDWRLFNRTGVSHLMSISGMHVTMTAAMAAWCTVFFWNRIAVKLSLPNVARLPNRRRLAWIFAIATALLYCALAGWGIPAQRTVFTVVFIGLLAHHRAGVGALWVLQAVAFCILILDPWAVLTIGFWLSFLAVAGLMLQGTSPDQLQLDPARQSPKTTQETIAEKSPKQLLVEHFFKHTLVQALRAQWACTWMLLPALAYFFGSISAVSVVANALAIPVIGLIITPLALVSAVLCLMLPTFAMPLAVALIQSIAWLLNGLFKFLLWLDQSLAAQWIVGQPSLLVTVISTFLIMLALARSWTPVFQVSRWHYLFKSLLLSISTALLVLPAVSKSSVKNTWEVTFFDVGQGSAIMIRSEDKVVLFDAGPQQSIESDAGSNTIVPALRLLGIRKIDLLVLSHLDAGHIGGLNAILDAMPIEKIWTGLPDNSVQSQRIENTTKLLKNSAIESCQAGLTTVIAGLELEVLHPPNLVELQANSDQVQGPGNQTGEVKNTEVKNIEIKNTEVLRTELNATEEDANEAQTAEPTSNSVKPKRSKSPPKKVDNNASSCVLMIRGGEHKVLLTADIQVKQERWLVEQNGDQLKADVLAMPGQGAASGSSALFLQAVQPKFAVSQAGYGNRWKIPNKVLPRYQQLGIQVERTDQQGAIRFQFGNTTTNSIAELNPFKSFNAPHPFKQTDEAGAVTVETARHKRDAYWRIKP
jgi:competence protein ComEC